MNFAWSTLMAINLRDSHTTGNPAPLLTLSSLDLRLNLFEWRQTINLSKLTESLAHRALTIEAVKGPFSFVAVFQSGHSRSIARMSGLKSLMENVLHGYDVLPSAVHLTADGLVWTSRSAIVAKIMFEAIRVSLMMH
jgi:hypothetical protein